MRLKDFITKSKNSLNKQSIWNPKKRKLKEIGITEDDILNIKIDKNLMEVFK